MDRTKLKEYARQARRDFIQAMTDRAAFYGLKTKKIEPIVERGDVAVIAGREHPRTVAKKRGRLEDRIKRHGFEQTMEALAYTWFNRLVAIRFMELHSYLEHGYRVLSHPERKPTPEILEHAEHVDLPGLNRERVIDFKLAGNREPELFRLLLIAQCNALNTAMPFLFEKIDHETELLLPDSLLHSDSLIRRLVNEIDEEDWQEVEIIGWLYQFYISEKKEAVIGRVVASEDIPAATQLFTPNWIVKYLVQNALGRQWLATYPQSDVRQEMPFYIEPAEQTGEVRDQLKTITPTSLNPEELTLLDPACGSGHILVEAYDLFKSIYRERGYRAQDIPSLILQKNLFGLEIDDRAAQLSAFALMMKARADDRRIFDRDTKPNILAFEDSQGMNAADITHALNAATNEEDLPSEYLIQEIEEEKAGLFSKNVLADKGHVSHGDIASLLALFENAKTFGSLIQVPRTLAAKLPEIEQRVAYVLKRGDLTQASSHVIKPLLAQARLLATQYDAVVANPPYMGSKGMNAVLKQFARVHFPDSKSDLFACSIERFTGFAKPTGLVGLMTPFTWMFLKSYEPIRRLLLDTKTLYSLIQPEYHAFFDSAYVPVCTFVAQNCHTPAYNASFIKLSDFYGAELQPQKTLEAIRNPDCDWLYRAVTDHFRRIPGSPIAYWASDAIRNIFNDATLVGSITEVRQGLATGDNNRFLRRWHEIGLREIGFGQTSTEEAQGTGLKWFPYNKGGDYRKWFGNHSFVVNWEDDGREIRAFGTEDGEKPKSRAQSTQFYFRPSLSWSKITSGGFSLRSYPAGFVFDVAGCSIFGDNLEPILGCLNSAIMTQAINSLSPTLNFEVGQVQDFPFIEPANEKPRLLAVVDELVREAQCDWDLYEESWHFVSPGLIRTKSPTVESSYALWIAKNSQTINNMKRLEEENNRFFIEAYRLQDVLTPDVPVEHITLTVNPAYRYGGKLTEEERWTRFRQDTVEELVSYGIGCMMGRYSLDRPGLIYAHGGNQGFDASHYTTFPADDDGIMPLLEIDWGIRDDLTNRIVEFIGVVWPNGHLEENLKFIADSLGPTSDEGPRDTIRRYLATGFYKDHLSIYKKRPIYWLFSSGRRRAFQCLVYLHRYHEGTVARMRTEYVIPLQGQIAARIEQLEGNKVSATSTSHRRKLQKQQDDLKKQQAELSGFEEKLKHAADQRISLDLDDGVRMNYAKFGDLLAESKAVTGGTDDE